VTTFGAANEDEFTELVDANIPRVDLVGKGANGMPFLIAKSAAGVLPDDFVRNLISKEGRVPKKFKYRHRGLIITAARRLNVGEVRAVAQEHLIAKAKDAASVPVYDANGALVGTVDPEKINTFAAYPGAEEDKPAETPMPDLTPAPSDDAGIPSTDVEKAAGRFDFRDAAEREVAVQVLKHAFAQAGPDVSPAARAIVAMHATHAAAAAVAMHATHAAAAAVERHRAQRRKI
jgi:hypothetical protein